ncbi:MAG: hypothetical protein FWF06_01195 [Symbiobacteriaceae bacterium]|nr:hypothetical protein [Symbiobacteriaceae bacterium]
MSVIREYEVTTRNRSDLEHNETVQELEAKLLAAPYDGDLWMERGLALSRQSLYRSAVESYSRAIALNPFKGIYYRHRGHRFLSIHRFEDACADFTMASRLIPDNWDVWYHLGLSWFLLADYAQAHLAYRRCLELTNSDDKLIAIADWLWITLKRLGLEEEAQELLGKINSSMDPGENIAYFNRLHVYKGEMPPERLLEGEGTAINIVTMGFGLANYYRLSGEKAKAREMLQEVIRQGDVNNIFGAFGYLAAMVDLERWE